MVPTIQGIAKQHGDAFFKDRHVRQWIDEVYADHRFGVRAEFSQPAKDGSYSVTMTAYPKG